MTYDGLIKIGVSHLNKMADVGSELFPDLQEIFPMDENPIHDHSG